MFEEPNKLASAELTRSLVDSVAAVAESTASIVDKLGFLVSRNEGRDELFQREVRQAQSYLVEFRHKMESVNLSQVDSASHIQQVVSQTVMILSKVEELNKDLTRYLYESKDQLWERYQHISDTFGIQVANLKSIQEDMQERCGSIAQHQTDTISKLELISNIVKSCDASLSAMNRNLPQDLAEAFENSHEQRLANLEDKVTKLLKIAYEGADLNEDGKAVDGFTKFSRWVVANFKLALGKIFAEILIFLVLWFYFMSGKIDATLANAVRGSNPSQPQVQSQVSQTPPEQTPSKITTSPNR